MKELSGERREFKRSSLDKSSITENPFDLIATWLDEAASIELDHTAMVLSTSSENKPSARVVLLKEVRNSALVFFTNYKSKKGLQLEANSFASLNFFWPNCERQLRIEGTVSKVSAEESDTYFYSRPLESQIGAIASNQSAPLLSRDQLEDAFERLKNSPDEIRRPEHWGGFELHPTNIEFWQGRASRLHDRFEYQLVNGLWTVRMLYP